MQRINAAEAARMMEALTAVVVGAGKAILGVNRAGMQVDGKSDGSPVTEADLAADRILTMGLRQTAPDIAIVSEEQVQALPPRDGSYFLVDPLDGTREFIAGRDEFTINVAIVSAGIAVLGIIAAPALGWIWRGIPGRGAERARITNGTIGAGEAIRCRPMPGFGKPWIAVVSRSHGDGEREAFITRRPNSVRHALGSAVKFCRIAEGGADIYPRLGPTSEWDIGAGCAIVTAAGGRVTSREGGEIRFGAGAPGFLVPGFIAWGDPRESLSSEFGI
ncbi:MAG: 3'(2'),5'-bisphosphate nucleotidase CysQ [Alphaproteobacteria bacterium]|nr:3'(2'),5'-bisphosphate nucleotidase CysQ [Alphaproteobacteria bacterium]